MKICSLFRAQWQVCVKQRSEILHERVYSNRSEIVGSILG